jgi:hypothetical protein
MRFCRRIGLVPRQDSTGGKQKLGPISKQGDRYVRRILVVGAHSVLRRAGQNPEKYPWLAQLLARRPFKVVAIALANKMARVAWALPSQGWQLSSALRSWQRKRLSDMVALYRVYRPLAGQGVFLTEGDEWRRQGRMLAPLFTPASIVSHFLRGSQRTGPPLGTLGDGEPL